MNQGIRLTVARLCAWEALRGIPRRGRVRRRAARRGLEDVIHWLDAMAAHNDDGGMGSSRANARGVLEGIRALLFAGNAGDMEWPFVAAQCLALLRVLSRMGCCPVGATDGLAATLTQMLADPDACDGLSVHAQEGRIRLAKLVLGEDGDEEVG